MRYGFQRNNKSRRSRKRKNKSSTRKGTIRKSGKRMYRATRQERREDDRFVITCIRPALHDDTQGIPSTLIYVENSGSLLAFDALEHAYKTVGNKDSHPSKGYLGQAGKHLTSDKKWLIEVEPVIEGPVYLSHDKFEDDKYYYGYVSNGLLGRAFGFDNAIFINANGTWLAYLIDLEYSSAMPNTVGYFIQNRALVGGYVCGPSSAPSADPRDIIRLLDNDKLNDFFFVQKMLGDSLTSRHTKLMTTEKDLRDETIGQIMNGTGNTTWDEKKVYAVGYVDLYNQRIYGLAEYNDLQWYLYDSHHKFARAFTTDILFLEKGLQDNVLGVPFDDLPDEDKLTFETRINFTENFLHNSRVKLLLTTLR
jgi:hypothetical protein